MYVFMYGCMHACTVRINYVSMHECIYVCIYVCIYFCMCRYVCTYVYACFYVCMHACIVMHFAIFSSFLRLSIILASFSLLLLCPFVTGEPESSRVVIFLMTLFNSSYAGQW